MTWFLTSKGTTIDLAYINPDAIDITDVAHSLAHINRFNGHAIRAISQAEHSLAVLEVIRRHFNIQDPAVQAAALLSHGHEYLTGHISRPMKELIGCTEWDVIEARIQKQFLSRFGLTTAFHTFSGQIWAANQYALSVEREQLMPADGETWPCQIKYPASAVDWLRFNDCRISWRPPLYWARQFLDEYHHLTRRMNERLSMIAPAMAIQAGDHQ
ncbi:MAG: hypothetical protein EPO09_00110 [Aquabacterium sp.]|uniref:hypothetical protein n=1 Tax=Aquabacterium sp. TaxID=1872578 RepID=UPI001212E3EB|nr:hypothetical protein [Aquabacterium sp.]TAL00156.1 MAG: hypothetical protein EPO09_00110 [Aquabacterium sp.]